MFDRDGIKVTALGIPHGNLPTLAYRVETRGKTVVFSSDQNGTNPRFVDFAKGANLLILHLAIGVGANNPNQALPAVVGQMAQSANPGRLILSHIANFDLDAAVCGCEAELQRTSDGWRRPAVHASSMITTGKCEPSDTADNQHRAGNQRK